MLTAIFILLLIVFIEPVVELLKLAFCLFLLSLPVILFLVAMFWR